MKSSARGADTVTYLASSPEVEGVSGQYFVNRRAARSNAESYEPAVASRLWKVSEELTAVTS
jgi:retinol dehydrogenase 14